MKKIGGKAAPSDDSTSPPLSAYIDGSPVPTFAIDAKHLVTHWNRACEQATGKSPSDMVGSSNHWQPFYPERRPTMADLIVDGSIDALASAYYHEKLAPSSFIPGAYETEVFFPDVGGQGRWLFFSAAPLRDAGGRIVGAIETLQDVTARKLAEVKLQEAQFNLEKLVADRTVQLALSNARLEIDIRERQAAEAKLRRRNAELTELNVKLSMAQQQLMQSEKLASIGQLAAGVAHEINNPIGYIFSNFNALEIYLKNLLTMLAAYEEAEASIAAPDVVDRLHALREQVELAYLKEDISVLMRESKEGIARVRQIVQDLKDFSRIDGGRDWEWANLHRGIDSTLNVVNNEVKYKADIIKEYGTIPDIECLPSQINQVIMNMVVNAAHAIGSERGKITIRTGADEATVWIEIADTGTGISKEDLPRLFDPFFTTKPVGKGTGLGLSLSYGIVRKHQGRIDVESEVGKGSCFRITLPIRHVQDTEQEAS